MRVRLGIFVVPDAMDPGSMVGQVLAADAVGLDIVGVQDHPYQHRFFDTWTLLAYLAGRTTRLRFLPDVLNLPLRSPAVIAKSVASLDVLSGGRPELGLGAGAFWDAVEAMGGPRRTPKESVDALEEAVAIIGGCWSGERSLTFEGEHYRVKGMDLRQHTPSGSGSVPTDRGCWGSPADLQTAGCRALAVITSVPRMCLNARPRSTRRREPPGATRPTSRGLSM
jgi:alkanesulfonate monooxygenase SsuD/methylene tetrahydromethanopterin reductase-like flavin-dependent oxidoreductase (luciferase family)